MTTILRSEYRVAADLARTAHCLERAQRRGVRPGAGGHLVKHLHAAMTATQALQDIAKGARAGRDDPNALVKAINTWTECRDALAESAAVALGADDPRMERAARRVLAMLDRDGETD